MRLGIWQANLIQSQLHSLSKAASKKVLCLNIAKLSSALHISSSRHKLALQDLNCVARQKPNLQVFWSHTEVMEPWISEFGLFKLRDFIQFTLSPDPQHLRTRYLLLEMQGSHTCPGVCSLPSTVVLHHTDQMARYSNQNLCLELRWEFRSANLGAIRKGKKI